MRPTPKSIPNPHGRPALAGVLIVDPDADTRLLYRTALEPVGVVVTEAEDGAEAFGKSLCDPPAVLVMETRLPRLNGLALCASLRRHPLTACVHIIIATSAASADLETRAARAGADEVLVKPHAIEELIAKVRAGISKRDDSESARAIQRIEGEEAREVTGLSLNLGERSHNLRNTCARLQQKSSTMLRQSEMMLSRLRWRS